MMKRICGNILRTAVALSVSVPLLYGAWLLARAFVMDYFTIPTESMCPTLKPGDKVIVDKLIFGARIYKDFDFNLKGQELKSWRTRGMRSLKHNDIVVFNFPHHDNMFNFVINNVFCKRIIALPGDSLSIVNGHYSNNNFDGELGLTAEQDKLSERPDTTFPRQMLVTIPYDDGHFGWTIYSFGPMYIPRKGDTIRLTAHEGPLYWMLVSWETGKFITWDWDTDTFYADGKPLRQHTFRHSYYFMAGDNVMDSSDSRYWGLVPEEYIVGVVSTIIRGRRIISAADID